MRSVSSLAASARAASRSASPSPRLHHFQQPSIRQSHSPACGGTPKMPANALKRTPQPVRGSQTASPVALPAAAAVRSTPVSTVSLVFKRAGTRVMNAGRGVFDLYIRLLDAQPLATKMVTSAIIGGVSDAACQLFVEDAAEFSFVRLRNMMIIGAVVAAPILHVWYGVLATRIPGSGWRTALKRMAADQILLAPAFIGLFFVVVAVMQGVPHEAPSRLRNGWANAVTMNYSVWPLAQLLNFGLVPIQYQVLFSNCVGLLWNVFLSMALNKKA